MSSDRRGSNLKSNIIYSSLYQILIIIVPIITTPYVTRIFDANQMGDYSLSLSLASFFVIISQFGIETYGVREISKASSSQVRENIFFQLFSIQSIISLSMFIIFNLIFLLLGNTSNKLLYLTQSLLIIVNITDISWFFIGIEEIKRTIMRNLFTKVFTTLSILLFVNSEEHLIRYALINVLGMLAGNMTMIASSTKYIKFSNIMIKLNRKHVWGSFKLLIPKILTNSFDALENGAIKTFDSTISVGIYSQAKKINNLLFAVINSSVIALSPRMSYYVSSGQKNLIEAVLYKGIKFANLFSVFLIGGIFAVSTEFVGFFFGPGYDDVGPVLQTLSLSLLFVPIIALLSKGLLIPYGKDKEYSFSVLIIIFVGLILNVILDPFMGPIGAAISYLVSQFISFVYISYILKSYINMRSIYKKIIVTIMVSFVNIIAVNYLKMFLNIENLLLSFLFWGLTSVALNMCLIIFINLKLVLKKFNHN